MERFKGLKAQVTKRLSLRVSVAFRVPGFELGSIRHICTTLHTRQIMNLIFSKPECKQRSTTYPAIPIIKALRCLQLRESSEPPCPPGVRCPGEPDIY